jgi:hypothetical protein
LTRLAMTAPDIRFEAGNRRRMGMNARWSGSFKPCGPWMRWKIGRYFAAPTRKLPAALRRDGAGPFGDCETRLRQQS